MNYKIPELLESDRLILRKFKEDDWVDLHAYYSDEECMQYTLGRTLTEGESWRTLAGMLGHWELRGYGPYAVVLKETNQVIGPVGLWYPNDWPEPEIKWGLIRSFWGQGFVTEAARAVKQMAAVHVADISLISLIYAGNERSINVALALGAILEKKIEFRGQDALIFRHRSP